MKILIIEDEPRAASSLEKSLLKLRPDTEIIGKSDSVKSSVALLRKVQPDLIFMDIQLSDGLSLDILNQVEVAAPIIFCTAFDGYSIDAFKKNGIDYLLKPFSDEDIERALSKVESLGKFFRHKEGEHNKEITGLKDLIERLTTPAGKTSFLVFHQQKYITVPTDQIAYFFVQHHATCLKCFDQKEYVINHSLDQVASEVSEKQFFRANRQYLVAFKAIKQVEPYFKRKLLVQLSVDTKEKILVNKEKAPHFLAWMENR